MNSFFRRVSAVTLGLFLVGISFVKAEEARRVAVFYPENGHWADVGLSMLNAYEIGFDWVNLEPLYIDCSDSLELARQLTDLTRNPRIVAFIGGMPGRASKLIASEAARAGIPYIVDCNSNDSLTMIPGRCVFRIAPPASEINNGLVSWASTVAGRNRTGAVLYDRGSSFDFLRRDLSEDLAAHWQGDNEWIAYDPGATDFSGQIRHFHSSRPVVLWLLGSRMDIARFLRQCRTLDWMPYAFLIGYPEIADNRLISASEGAAYMLLAPSIWGADEAYRNASQITSNYWLGADEADRTARGFMWDYYSMNDEEQNWRAAASFSATEILNEILSDDLLTREEITARLEDGQFETVFGTIRFENYGKFYNQNRRIPEVVQLNGSSWVQVWPELYAVAEDVYPVPDWRERARSEDTPRREKGIDLLLLMTWLTLALYIGLRGFVRKS